MWITLSGFSRRGQGLQKYLFSEHVTGLPGWASHQDHKYTELNGISVSAESVAMMCGTISLVRYIEAEDGKWDYGVDIVCTLEMHANNGDLVSHTKREKKKSFSPFPFL